MATAVREGERTERRTQPAKASAPNATREGERAEKAAREGERAEKAAREASPRGGGGSGRAGPPCGKAPLPQSRTHGSTRAPAASFRLLLNPDAGASAHCQLPRVSSPNPYQNWSVFLPPPPPTAGWVPTTSTAATSIPAACVKVIIASMAENTDLLCQRIYMGPEIIFIWRIAT